jgi:hypothetical protein
MNDIEIYIDNARGQVPLKDALNLIHAKINANERLSLETANDLRLACETLLHRYGELKSAAKEAVRCDKFGIHSEEAMDNLRNLIA